MYKEAVAFALHRAEGDSCQVSLAKIAQFLIGYKFRQSLFPYRGLHFTFEMGFHHPMQKHCRERHLICFVRQKLNLWRYAIGQLKNLIPYREVGMPNEVESMNEILYADNRTAVGHWMHRHFAEADLYQIALLVCTDGKPALRKCKICRK